jgi:hypothetical protein
MVESIRVNEGIYTVNDLARHFMGLSKLGLLRDPFIDWYRDNGLSFDREPENKGMSVDGLMNTFALKEGRIQEGDLLENSKPTADRLCYVAKRGLSEDGMRNFYNKTKEMVRDGIISLEEFKTIEEAYLLKDVGAELSQFYSDLSTFPEFPCSYTS